MTTLPLRPLLAAALAALLAGCGAEPDAPLAGYAEAELVYVAASAGGTLRTLDVRRGDPVKAGQRLFALDADAELLSRQAADARLTAAEAQTDDLRKGKRPLELAALDAQLAQARATLVASESALARQRSLVAQGFVSAARLDELVAARDADAAHVGELQAQRRLADEAARSDTIAAAAASARGAGSDAALARWHEEQKTRAAPVAALVYDTLYRPGEWVAAGAPVVALLPPGAIKLRFFVPEPLLARAAVGATVAVSCDGCPAGLKARIGHVSPEAEYTPPVIYSNESRSKLVFRAEAWPEGQNTLKPGQPVELRLADAAR